MNEADYQASLDLTWRKLRPHLEWTQGFALAVLFSRHSAPIKALRNRLREVLSLNTLPLRRFELKGPEQAETILHHIFASRPLDGKHPPLWLELWRQEGGEEERQAQRRAVWEVLSRLNERRFLLERDVACPMVLVLPAELRMDVPAMIPDLWSVRAVTADLPTPGAVAVEAETARDVSTSLPPQVIISREPTPAEQEWRRLWAATPVKQRLAPEAAFPAIGAALERHDFPAARSIALQVMQALDQRGENPTVSRQRAIALNFLGDVEQALNRFDEARGAYAESLELSRRLRAETGDTPQALRDLSVSLNKLGDVEKALNRFDEARGAYAESLELFRRLREATGDTPQALRDLSISLERLGDVE
ncbi:MAG: tetratricopeptide repeat protein, partial [Desulfobulbaceae bacterium]|nr:tetratricopeptide repeat protein [Desulfobulbaceae bacterium]